MRKVNTQGSSVVSRAILGVSLIGSVCIVFTHLLWLCCRCPCSAHKDAALSWKAEPKARGEISGGVCWCGGVQVASLGLHPLPDQCWDGGDQEEGGGALSARLRPPNAEAVGGKRRCHVWSAVPKTQNYYTFPLLISNVISPIFIFTFLLNKPIFFSVFVSQSMHKKQFLPTMFEWSHRTNVDRLKPEGVQISEISR